MASRSAGTIAATSQNQLVINTGGVALDSRGYEVALPMARGFSKSGGTIGHDGCDSAEVGLGNAADITAAIGELQLRPEVDRTRVVVAGQRSFGGWTAMAYGTAPGRGVRGLIGFSPAIRESIAAPRTKPWCGEWDGLAVAPSCRHSGSLATTTASVR